MDAEATSTFNAEQLATLLPRGPLAAAAAQGAALVIGAGDPPRAVFATPAALRTFGVNDLNALNATVFAAGSPGARRIRELAKLLPLGGAPRLESLRFFVGRLPIPVGWLCARLTGLNGEALLVAAAVVRQSEAASPAPVEPGATHVEIAPIRDVAEATSPTPACESPPFSPPPPDGPVRFLWSLDADGRFGAPDETMVSRLGPQAPLAGESLASLRGRLPIDPEGEWARAVELSRTFSGLRLEWPEVGGVRARVVTLSGAPAFNRDRKPSGFRGFGVFSGETVARRPSPRELDVVSAAPTVEKRDADPADPVVVTPLATVFQEPVVDAPIEAHTVELSHGGEPSALPPSVLPPVDIKAVEPLAASPRGFRDGGAEIFVLRPPSSPNVVPIRPGALNVLTPPVEEPEPPRVKGDSVELTPLERDAFKEIARALGVRPRAPVEAPRDAKEPVAAPEKPKEIPPASVVEADARREVTAASEARDDFARLLDQMPIGALVLRDGQALYLNKTLLDLVGFASVEDFRARDGLKTIFRGRDPESLAPVGEGGGMPLSSADGEFLAVDAQARAIAWAGAPAVLISMRRSREAEHQEELRAAELEVRRHAHQARDNAAALDVAADGMIRLDATGHILGMNAGAERLLGYDQKEAAGESFLMLLAPASQAEATAAFDRLTHSQGLSADGERLLVTARGQSGRTLPARLDFGRATNTDQTEYFAVLRDLTELHAHELELRLAREAAETANARKTDFLARVSHEIRTPLHAILGFAEVIMEERFGPIGNERYKDYIKDIHASGKHVVSLANDLLDLAKIEAGKIELEFAPIDVNKIIRECVALMQPQAAKERIIMRLSLFDKLPNVMADERSLRQIMLNLLSNAVKYNEPGGQVIVSTALDEAGHAVIRVRDTGIGMSESELSVALEPFRRVQGGKRDDGTGLGLPLTKALVEANHADFAIKSRKDHGTLVEVAFANARAAQ